MEFHSKHFSYVAVLGTLGLGSGSGSPAEPASEHLSNLYPNGAIAYPNRYQVRARSFPEGIRSFGLLNPQVTVTRTAGPVVGAEDSPLSGTTWHPGGDRCPSQSL